MSDGELEVYIPDSLQDEWLSMLGYDKDGNVSRRWASLSDEEPNSDNPAHRRLMVQVANEFLTQYDIPLTVLNVKDADDELVWLVQTKPRSRMNESSKKIKLKAPLKETHNFIRTKERTMG